MKRIVIANSNCYRIFDYDRTHKLTLVKEHSHPENRLKNSELNSDRPGRFASHGFGGGAYTQETDTKSVHINQFARNLACELDKERNHHEYGELVLIIPSHMNGLVERHLSKQVKELVTCTIQKNLIRLSELGLLRYLNSHIWH